LDKQFWLSVKENNFALPEEHSILFLTEELFSFIASTDPELRDAIGLEAFYNWLTQGLYSVDELRGFITRLMANLQIGISETGSDTVFLRSFSALWLANIVSYDNETLLLKKEAVLPVLDAAIVYFATERDIRGYVPIKGYAHAIAHAADLLWTLAISLHTDAKEHLKILDCIAIKLRDATLGIYRYNEDSRIARAIISIFKRATLSLDQIEAWLVSLGSDWNGAWQNEGRTQAFNNVRNLLRALYWYILMQNDDGISNKDDILQLLQKTLEQARPWE
jgi:hypothetical protein